MKFKKETMSIIPKYANHRWSQNRDSNSGRKRVKPSNCSHLHGQNYKIMIWWAEDKHTLNERHTTTAAATTTTTISGTWWRLGWDDDFQPESRRFDSRSSRHVGTLGKSFTCSCFRDKPRPELMCTDISYLDFSWLVTHVWDGRNRI